MAERFEFELVFALPDSNTDPVDLSNAIFEAGFDDAIVATGLPGLVAVELDMTGQPAEGPILDAVRRLLAVLPAGSRLREVRPDLVSLADVAERLGVRRQALQKRAMPAPSFGGLYRVDEIAESLHAAAEPGAGRRRPRFDLSRAENWLRAGPVARRINARLTLNEIDPWSGRTTPDGKGPGVETVA
ncbi:hypothetical protein [Stappia sp.]|uniref:hypothetical protein n=1 Tax=Stappia sp. TaxID=1870903 RepID=UPI0032D90069